MKKVVLITGVTGQNSSCLDEFLLAKDRIDHADKRGAYLFSAVGFLATE